MDSSFVRSSEDNVSEIALGPGLPSELELQVIHGLARGRKLNVSDCSDWRGGL